MSQTIEVLLTSINEEDVLMFKLDDNHPDDFYIELNSDSNQTQIKNVFSKLLEILVEFEVELKLVIAEGYSKGLYKDVVSEYVEDLNAEINAVGTQIRERLK